MFFLIPLSSTIIGLEEGEPFGNRITGEHRSDDIVDRLLPQGWSCRLTGRNTGLAQKSRASCKVSGEEEETPKAEKLVC